MKFAIQKWLWVLISCLYIGDLYCQQKDVKGQAAKKQKYAAQQTAQQAAQLAPVPIKNIEPKQLKLHDDMRRLWTDHGIWTRCYIISAVADLPDVTFAADRLMRNQQDIGRAITGYYGKEAGARLTDLLTEHIRIATDIIKAAKANQQTELQKSQKAWDQNALDIAQFLSAANPAWPYKDMSGMLRDHLKLTADELDARLKKNWKKDIESFDKVLTQLHSMADVLSNGIVGQFPDKF